MKLDSQKVGMALGALMGGMHLAWAVLVSLGLAQSLMDFIYSIHFLNNPFTITAFDLTTAAILVAVTAAIGYVIGWAFAKLWNFVQK